MLGDVTYAELHAKMAREATPKVYEREYAMSNMLFGLMQILLMCGLKKRVVPTQTQAVYFGQSDKSDRQRHSSGKCQNERGQDSHTLLVRAAMPVH